MTKPLVIYHGGCRDGFCAAWLAHHALKDAELVPAIFDTPPPDVRNRDVYILDFSYPRPVMEQIANQASSLIVLDHHEGSQSRVKGFPGIFDPNRSGAGLALVYFQIADPLKAIVALYVEDRDLWRFRASESRAVNAYLHTLPFTLEVWDDMAANWNLETYAKRGYAILSKTTQYVWEVKNNAISINFEGFRQIPLVNAPHVDISDLLAAMATNPAALHPPRNVPFAMGWCQRSDGKFNYNLRANPNWKPYPINVATLAQKYGGSGHPASSGFVVEKPIHFEQQP